MLAAENLQLAEQLQISASKLPARANTTHTHTQSYLEKVRNTKIQK